MCSSSSLAGGGLGVRLEQVAEDLVDEVVEVRLDDAGAVDVVAEDDEVGPPEVELLLGCLAVPLDQLLQMREREPSRRTGRAQARGARAP